MWEKKETLPRMGGVGGVVSPGICSAIQTNCWKKRNDD